RQGEILRREAPVMRAGEPIGKVLIEMSTQRLEAAIDEQWHQVLMTGVLQLVLGMLIIFPLLRYKVLAPVDRLVSQSKELADGKLDRPLDWRRADELGVLGKSFEATRLSLRNLVRNLEKRNRELIAHQAELAKRSEVLRATLDNMTDGITLIDDELRLVGWNDRMAEFMGVPRDMFREGTPVAELVDYDLAKRGLSEAERRAQLEDWHKTFQPGAASASRYCTSGGREIDIRRQPMPGGGFVSTFTDVTEQVAIQRRQEATRRLLETVMDAVPAVLHVKDRRLCYQMVNQQFLDAWSITREAAIGRTNAELFDNEPARRAEERDRQVLESRRPLPFYEGARLAADGGAVVTWTTKVPLLDSAGEVEHILTVDLDITDRKRAEEEIKRWLQLFEDAIESLANGFAVFDKSLHLLTCNSAYASLYGETPDKLVGIDVNDLLPRLYPKLKSIEGRPVDGNTAAAKRDFEQIWDARGDQPIEVELKDGRSMLISRHPTKEGGYATIRTDVTELKALEAEQARQREALYQSEKINALGALLAGVAHELNNPLSVVVGQALLLSETVEDPKIRKRAERIGQSADRCSRIVKTFLAMARQSEPTRTAVDLNETIESALEITGYTLRSANIEVVRQLAAELPPVWGDADQLGQVLMNLIINAEQAMADTIGERRLTIATAFDAGQDQLEITVSDTGPGIPEDIRSRIFEPFFTTKSFGVGTGIGLAVSLGIVQSHGGSLEASDAPDGGARFTLRLPPSAEAAAAAGAGPETAAAGGPCRVLVVDDEPEVSDMLAEILSMDGHEIEVASSGNAAMRILAERSVDVVLSDMRMPDLDGPGLYLRIKNAYPELLGRVVFITGDTLGPANRAFLERTGLPHLEKPLLPDQVRQVVHEVLAGAGAARPA
ncbi:MAG: PAS-domain containing protein, partial [Kiloniellales bacterium]|nr:PAS-domain containing protein [Kiloniellales bacterium]